MKINNVDYYSNITTSKITFDEETELMTAEIVNICVDESILGENGKRSLMVYITKLLIMVKRLFL